MSPRTADEVFAQLHAAGVVPWLRAYQFNPGSVTGRIDLRVIRRLRADPRFCEGPLHGLHADVGEDRLDFRSDRGAFGWGSLQIVVDKTTGRFYADVDAHSPYTDLVNWIGHAGEVIGGWFKRKRKADTGAAV